MTLGAPWAVDMSISGILRIAREREREIDRESNRAEAARRNLSEPSRRLIIDRADLKVPRAEFGRRQISGNIPRSRLAIGVIDRS